MKSGFAILFAACSAVMLAQAPGFDFKALDKLGKNAKESSTINLDQNTIKLGAALMGDDSDADSKQFKDVVKGITGVVIRSFEFEKSGQYNAADLEPVRAYIRSLNWSKIVDVKGEKENCEIYLNTGGGSSLGGLAIISAEPVEVTVVYIAGKISLDQVGALSGKMGIPDIDLSNLGKTSKSRAKDSKKSKDDKDDQQ